MGFLFVWDLLFNLSKGCWLSVLDVVTRGRCTLRKCIDHQQCGSFDKLKSSGAFHCRKLCPSVYVPFTPYCALIKPTSTRRTGCAKTLEGLCENNRWDLLHRWLYDLLPLIHLFDCQAHLLNECMVISSLGNLKILKNGWIFPNVEKEKGGELFSFDNCYKWFLCCWY